MEKNEKKNCTKEDTSELTEKFVYAFNTESLDVFYCIISENNPSYNGYDEPGTVYNDAFYYNMRQLHQEKGDMEIGYYIHNGIVRTKIPYIKGYGWFDISADEKGKMCRVKSYPFDRKGINFVQSGEKIDMNIFEDFPVIISVGIIQKNKKERFALKAIFDNGEIKKYVISISEELEAVSYRRHVFSDGIWRSAVIENNPEPTESWYDGFKWCRPVVRFKNGYIISGMTIYYEGEVMPDEDSIHNDGHSG